MSLAGTVDETPPKKKHKAEVIKPAPTSVDARIASMANSLYSPLHEKIQEKKRKHSETEIEVEGTKEVHITLSPRTPPGDPPEPEELIKALKVISLISGKNNVVLTFSPVVLSPI